LSKIIEIKISVPSWIDEDEVKRVIENAIRKLEGKISVTELRERMKISEAELTENIETYDVLELRKKEKEKLYDLTEYE